MASQAFIAGVEAQKSGKTENDNPGIIGKTKLGSFKLSEDGQDWLNGFNSVKSRICNKNEVIQAERLTNLGQFRKRYRKW